MEGADSVGVCELGSETGFISLPLGLNRYRNIAVERYGGIRLTCGIVRGGRVSCRPDNRDGLAYDVLVAGRSAGIT